MHSERITLHRIASVIRSPGKRVSSMRTLSQLEREKDAKAHVSDTALPTCLDLFIVNYAWRTGTASCMREWQHDQRSLYYGVNN
jgi:hypothetical protein